MDKKVRCQGITRAGTTCLKNSMPRSKFCQVHHYIEKRKSEQSKAEKAKIVKKPSQTKVAKKPSKTKLTESQKFVLGAVKSLGYNDRTGKYEPVSRYSIYRHFLVKKENPPSRASINNLLKRYVEKGLLVQTKQSFKVGKDYFTEIPDVKNRRVL